MITINKEKPTPELDSQRKINYLLNNASLVFATGIVNPFGPTLSLYYIEKSTSSLLWVMVHPSETRLFKAGEVRLKGRTRIKEIEFYADSFGGMPTIFIKGSDVLQEMFEEFVRAHIDHCDGASDIYKTYKANEGDSAARVKSEISSAMDFIDSGEMEEDKSSIDKEDFLRLLLKPENVEADLELFYDYYMNCITYDEVQNFQTVFGLL